MYVMKGERAITRVFCESLRQWLDIFCTRVRETGARVGEQNPFFFAGGRNPCTGVRERVSDGGRQWKVREGGRGVLVVWGM